MGISRIYTLLAILLLCQPMEASAKQVNLLVVAIHGVESAKREWQPTVDYLGRSLPQHSFKLTPVIPAELTKIRSLVQSGEIDFVISQPAIYVDLELNFGISRILTMVKQGGYSQFGSIIIVRADSDINELEDLRGKTIAGVANLGFGGWLVGYKEMLDNGFDPYTDAAQVIFLGTQPKEVMAVFNREVDAAVIRTGTLKKMEAEGKIDPTAFRILLAKSYPGFDLPTSTPLYPEWAFAKTRYVPNKLSKEVAQALLSLNPDDPVARHAGFQEWTYPYDYQPVHNLLKTLRVTPYQDYGKFTLNEVFTKHWVESLAIIILSLAVLIVILVWNRKLEKEIEIRKDIERKLRDKEKKLLLAASVFSHTNEGIAITDSNASILDVNEAFSQITGYRHDEVVGKNPRLLQSGRHDTDFYRSMWHKLKKHGHWQGVVWNRRKTGEIYAEKLSINAVNDEQRQVQRYVGIFYDITHQVDHEQHMEHLAYHDALTDLPNRVLFADRLQQAMAQVKRRGKQLAVVYLDLDCFKEINDKHGHDAGDKLLTSFSRRLQEMLREGDTAARLGGDEFVMILIDLTTDDDCIPLLQRLVKIASQPVHFDDQILHTSASLGVTFYPQAAHVDADQLMRQADQAMYQAKMAGKNRFHLFSPKYDTNQTSPTNNRDTTTI
jgi:diguanylate cyclase (GGDEF)-like protein/PAS domain S-box-containing protein